MTPNKDWDAVLETLSDLILFKNRADAGTWRDAYENMNVYLRRVGLEDDIKKLSIIHVAGTKGKGSTCAMTESMLRQCGYRTGLYTSPHLVDVRERIRINGEMVDRAVFEEHFWWCYERFKEQATPEVGVPGYFRFMTLLALRIFLAQGIDVVLLEVGVGGRLDATNVVPQPVVCGITSLGLDHMEMLGDTLPKIAREKAGILKRGSPGYTVQQPDDAMEALKECAARAGTSLEVVPPLAASPGGPAPVMALGGAHMLVNAGMAVKLASEWERLSEAGRSNPGSAARLLTIDQGGLPAEYARGLELVQWPGRSQVVPDAEFAIGQPEQVENAAQKPSSSSTTSSTTSSRLMFYIDGAHTPESMATCADWFADQTLCDKVGALDVHRVLLFNCMKERDPALLLPILSRSLAARGLHCQHALFVPADSQYGFLAVSKTKQAGSADDAAAAPAGATASATASATITVDDKPKTSPDGLTTAHSPDLTWQAHMQHVWESQGLGSKQAGPGLAAPGFQPPPLPPCAHAIPRGDGAWSAAVIPSLSSTLEWLRQYTRSAPRAQVQVLVTGSLYLVGDMLRLLGRVPK